MGEKKTFGEAARELTEQAGAAGTATLMLGQEPKTAALAAAAAGTRYLLGLVLGGLREQTQKTLEDFLTALAHELGLDPGSEDVERLQREMDAYLDANEGARAQLNDVVRKLLDTIDPAGVVPLARLVARARAHGQKGATSTFKAIARLLGQLSGDEIADLRVIVSVAKEERSERDPVDLEADEPGQLLGHTGPRWRVRLPREQKASNVPEPRPTAARELAGDAAWLFRLVRNSSIGRDVEPGKLRLSRSTLALLADVLGPEPAEVPRAAR